VNGRMADAKAFITEVSVVVPGDKGHAVHQGTIVRVDRVDFPGVQALSPEGPLPGSASTPFAVLSTVAQELKLPHAVRKLFLTTQCQSLLVDYVWWLVLNSFHPDARSQDELFARLSMTYVRIITDIMATGHPGSSERIFDGLAAHISEGLITATFAALAEAFPKDQHRLGKDEKFRKHAEGQLQLWTTGFELASVARPIKPRAPPNSPAKAGLSPRKGTRTHHSGSPHADLTPMTPPYRTPGTPRARLPSSLQPPSPRQPSPRRAAPSLGSARATTSSNARNEGAELTHAVESLNLEFINLHRRPQFKVAAQPSTLAMPTPRPTRTTLDVGTTSPIVARWIAGDSPRGARAPTKSPRRYAQRTVPHPPLSESAIRKMGALTYREVTQAAAENDRRWTAAYKDSRSLAAKDLRRIRAAAKADIEAIEAEKKRVLNQEARELSNYLTACHIMENELSTLHHSGAFGTQQPPVVLNGPAQSSGGGDGGLSSGGG